MINSQRVISLLHGFCFSCLLCLTPTTPTVAAAKSLANNSECVKSMSQWNGNDSNSGMRAKFSDKFCGCSDDDFAKKVGADDDGGIILIAKCSLRAITQLSLQQLQEDNKTINAQSFEAACLDTYNAVSAQDTTDKHDPSVRKDSVAAGIINISKNSESQEKKNFCHCISSKIMSLDNTAHDDAQYLQKLNNLSDSCL